MLTMPRLVVFAATLVAPIALSTTSWAWFWEKTNTVKSYEACLKNNSSQVLKFFDLSERCIEKLAGPVPVDQIELEYKQEYEYGALAASEQARQLGLDRKLHVVSLSSKNFLLTSAVAKVQIDNGDEIEVVAKPALPEPKQTVEAKFPVKHPSRVYVRCNSDKRFDCVSLRLVSAKGFQITID